MLGESLGEELATESDKSNCIDNQKVWSEKLELAI